MYLKLTLGLFMTLQISLTGQQLDNAKQMITRLASDEFRGRQTGSQGFEKAAIYSIDFMKKANVKPFFATGYKDPFELMGKPTFNVLGLIGKRDTTQHYILLSAHLDHIGIAADSLVVKGDSIYNGANDNASGVTAVLQIGKYLAEYSFKQNIILALFTGEEHGLLGSKHLAPRLKKAGYKIDYVLNFEMIGKTLTTGKNKVYLTGFNQSDMAEKINQFAEKTLVEFLPEAKQYNLFKRSDNYPFYETYGIPAQTFSSFDFKNYAFYHQLGDETKALDLDNMNVLIDSFKTVLKKLLDKGETFKWNPKQ